MSEQPRSRRQTRAAILGRLLQSGGMFRPPLAKAVRLSEASLSRILFDLKAEGLIEEVRRPAPYFGGPTGLVSLDNSVALAAIELTAQRLSVGVGGLSGELHYTERLPLPKTPTVASVGRVFHDALQLLGDWTRRRRVRLAQIGVSIPGLGRSSVSDNPIIPCDVRLVRGMLGEMFAGVPVEFTNSVVAHATFHRCRTEDYPFTGAHLFVFVGQGVAGAWMDDPIEADALAPVELGHMVFGEGGRVAAAAIMAVSRPIRRSPRWPSFWVLASRNCCSSAIEWVNAIPISSRVRQELRRRLFRLGLAIGNTLNVKPCPAWPSAAGRRFSRKKIERRLVDGIDACRVGRA